MKNKATLKLHCIVSAGLTSLILFSNPASANQTDWIRLDRIESFSKSVRSFGHNGLVTGVKCGIVDGGPSMKFTYELVPYQVHYRYAWSTLGEADYKATAKGVFKPGVKVLTCHMKNFYYATQNIR
ncbi:hypothetical protein ACWGTO_10985 [Mesorhizobium sp. PL10]